MVESRNIIKYGFCALFAFVVSCNEEMKNRQNNEEELPRIGENNSDANSLLVESKNSIKNSTINRKFDSNQQNSFPSGLVDIQTINPSIFVDLKYATTNNFMKMRLYDTLTKAYLQNDVAIRLGKCQEYLSTLYPSLFLLVYDAVRPISVQRKMWNALDTIPVGERGKFVSNPAKGSIHNYGAAVDITICTSKGVPLDMGAGYDDIRKIAYPSMENIFFKRGELTENHIQNRQLLRSVMASQNFTSIPTEWWHFNACSRIDAKAKYKPLQ
jgi:D-alanyl-D-alanine dipeptidase